MGRGSRDRNSCPCQCYNQGGSWITFEEAHFKAFAAGDDFMHFVTCVNGHDPGNQVSWSSMGFIFHELVTAPS